MCLCVFVIVPLSLLFQCLCLWLCPCPCLFLCLSPKRAAARRLWRPSPKGGSNNVLLRKLIIICIMIEVGGPKDTGGRGPVCLGWGGGSGLAGSSDRRIGSEGACKILRILISPSKEQKQESWQHIAYDYFSFKINQPNMWQALLLLDFNLGWHYLSNAATCLIRHRSFYVFVLVSRIIITC